MLGKRLTSLLDLTPKFNTVIELCQQGKRERSDPSFPAICELIKTTRPFNISVDLREKLISSVCMCFSLTRDELLQSAYKVTSLNGQALSRYHKQGYDALKAEEELDALIPESG